MNGRGSNSQFPVYRPPYFNLPPPPVPFHSLPQSQTPQNLMDVNVASHRFQLLSYQNTPLVRAPIQQNQFPQQDRFSLLCTASDNQLVELTNWLEIVSKDDASSSHVPSVSDSFLLHIITMLRNGLDRHVFLYNIDVC